MLELLEKYWKPRLGKIEECREIGIRDPYYQVDSYKRYYKSSDVGIWIY